ncbi:cysteine--tRNA ligase [bacterium]|nr:cysteine--tRNA ligase [bacterium]MBT3903408.1 cysteine--tRNA ligase [bacterium]MBT4578013.1 cysteine--tRNA ligase [bacterium]MBT5345763.1 cysteine--tRNA ligase [bacterium]MBT6130896.1 cysteine--tRNA ligase [bacterium]
MMWITNTQTRKKTELSPIKSGEVLLYVCGITPYDLSHLGHGRCYVTFDILYRLLGFLGQKVTYCRNFTDIDDKLLNKAQAEFGDKFRYLEIAQRCIDWYHEDMQLLNCISPEHEPRVTDNIPEIIAFVQGLIDSGKAYEVDGNVYFSIDSFADYGQLSGRNLDDLIAGARVEVNLQKRNPLDFALWKSEKEGGFWQSPWGNGRPGWHIECSALAKKFLGNQIDIHGGGMDLIFPHHENEKAQSEALDGVQFVKTWMHNAFVRIDKEKMSKSLGNFFTLRELFKKFDPMVVRYFFLKHHYQAPLDFTMKDLEATATAYRRLCLALQTDSGAVCDNVEESVVVQEMLKFLTDDLNTSGALGVLHSHLSRLQDDDQERACVAQFVRNILGLTLESPREQTSEITPEVQELIDARREARAQKNWELADRLRDELEAMGVLVQDNKL